MAIRYVGIEPDEAKTPPKDPVQKPANAVKAGTGAATAEELPLGQAAAPAKPKRKRS